MRLLRRKKTVQQFSLGPIRLEAAAFMEVLGDSPWMDNGEFDLLGFTTEMFDSGFLSTAEMLKAVGKDSDAFWLGANWTSSGIADRASSARTL